MLPLSQTLAHPIVLDKIKEEKVPQKIKEFKSPSSGSGICVKLLFKEFVERKVGFRGEGTGCKFVDIFIPFNS